MGSALYWAGTSPRLTPPTVDTGPRWTIDSDDLAIIRQAFHAGQPLDLGLRELNLPNKSALGPAPALDGTFQPRADVPAYRLEYPLNWRVDPYDDPNWRFQLHSWRMLTPSLAEVAHSNDTDHARYIARVILDWDRFHHAERKLADMSWNDMATGLRASTLAFVLDRWRSNQAILTEDELDQFLRLAGLHVAKLREPEFMATDNHGLAQAHGLMALCQVLDGWEPCSEARDYARQAMLTLLRSQFGEEGVQLEHSPGYHFFSLTIFQRIASTGWYDGDAEFRERLARAEANAAWLIDARGRLPTIGDTEPRRRSETLQAPNENETGLIAKLFAEAGYAHIRTHPAIVQTDAMSVFFTCSHHSHIHKQDDDLSFEWVTGGEPVLTDSGKYMYGSSPEISFVSGRSGHSSIEFHGVTTAPHLRPPYGGCLSQASVQPDGTARAQGSLTYPSHQTTHSRNITVETRSNIEVLDEVLEAPRRGYTVWWHFDPAFELSTEGDHRFIARSPTQEVLVQADAPGCTAQLHRGETHPKIQGWVSLRYGELTPRWALGLQCPAETERVETRFIASKRKSAGEETPPAQEANE